MCLGVAELKLREGGRKGRKGRRARKGWREEASWVGRSRRDAASLSSKLFILALTSYKFQGYEEFTKFPALFSLSRHCYFYMEMLGCL